MIDDLQDEFLNAAERYPHLWAIAVSRIADGGARPPYPDFKEWASLLVASRGAKPTADDERPAVGFPEPFSAVWTQSVGREWQIGFHNSEPIAAPSGMSRRERMDWEVTARKERYETLQAGREEFAALCEKAVRLFGLDTKRPADWPASIPFPTTEPAVFAWLGQLIETRPFQRAHGFQTVRLENIFATSADAFEDLEVPAAAPTPTTEATPDETSDGASSNGQSATDWRNQPIPPWLLQAMVLLHDEPEMADEIVARKVKTPVEVLVADPRYREVVERARSSAPAAPASNELQPGDPIPGSQFFVEVCANCGERIRVPRSQVGTQPICRTCAE